jgi:hypothetical protein
MVINYVATVNFFKERNHKSWKQLSSRKCKRLKAGSRIPTDEYSDSSGLGDDENHGVTIP